MADLTYAELLDAERKKAAAPGAPPAPGPLDPSARQAPVGPQLSLVPPPAPQGADPGMDLGVTVPVPGRPLAAGEQLQFTREPAAAPPPASAGPVPGQRFDFDRAGRAPAPLALAPPKSYREILDAQRVQHFETQKADDELDAGMKAYLATKSDLTPQQGLEIAALSRASGRTPEDVAAHLPEVKAAVSEEQLKATLIRSPKLRELFADPTKAAVFKDKLDDLNTWEWIFGKWEDRPGYQWQPMGGGGAEHVMTRAPAWWEAGKGGLIEQKITALANLQVAGDDSPETEAKLKELEAQVGGRTYGAHSIPARALVAVPKMAPYIIGSAASRFLAGAAAAKLGAAGGAAAGTVVPGAGTAAGAAVGGVGSALVGQYVGGAVFDFYQNVGPLYRNLRTLTGPTGTQLLSDAEARTLAVTTSVAVAAMTSGLSGHAIKGAPYVAELLGKSASKGFEQTVVNLSEGAGLRLLKSYGSHVGAGAAWMAVQAAGNASAVELAKGTHGEDWSPTPVFMAGYEGAKTGLQDMLLVAAWGPGRNFLRERGMVPIVEGEAANYQAIIDHAKASKVLEAGPAGQEVLGKLALGQGAIDRVYSPVADFDAYWTKKGASPRKIAAEIAGDGGASYDKAKADGAADVSFPIEAWVSKLGKSEDILGLKKDVKLHPDSRTARQQDAFTKQQDALVETAKDLSSPFNAELDGAEHAKFLELRAAGRTDLEARSVGQLYRVIIRDVALREAISPAEVLKKYPLKFQAAPEPLALTRTPRQQWVETARAAKAQPAAQEPAQATLELAPTKEPPKPAPPPGAAREAVDRAVYGNLSDHVRERLEAAGRGDSEALQELGRLALAGTKDPQTGADNRASFEAFAARPPEGGVHVSIDLNHLTQINELLGHEGGDQAIAVLRLVAHAAYGEGGQFFRRSQGDEFHAYLPTPAAAARFQAKASEILNLHPELEGDGNRHKVSLSAGFGDTIEAADRALFAAKEEALRVGRGGNEGKIRERLAKIATQKETADGAKFEKLVKEQAELERKLGVIQAGRRAPDLARNFFAAHDAPVKPTPAQVEELVAPQPHEEAKTFLETGRAPEGFARGAALEQGAGRPGLEGSAAKVITPTHPTGEVVQYRVIEAADLVASHDPITFQPDARYPEGVQERQYHSSKEEQGKVVMGEARFDPTQILTDTPSPADGPPLVTEGGRALALGGNGRSMMIRRAFRDPAKLEAYRAQLRAKAAGFGLDAMAIDKLKQPVLVRVVKGLTGEAPQADLVGAVRRYNESMTQAMSAKVKAVAEAKTMTDATVGSIGQVLADAGDLTLREVMRDNPRQLVEILRRDGIITNQNQAEWLAAGQLTDAGKDRLEGIFLGRIVGTSDRMAATSAGILAKLERATPALIRVAGVNPSMDMIPTVQRALDLVNDAHRRDVPIDTLLNQGSLFGGPAVDAETATMARLLDVAKQKELATRFKAWADAAAFDPKQATMFEVNATPAEAKAKLFDGQKMGLAQRGLDRDAVRALVGDDAEGALRGLMVEGGIHPDDLAVAVGAPSGEQLLRDLITAHQFRKGKFSLGQPGLELSPKVRRHETEEFRAWFRQSAAAAPDGTPLRLYHGMMRADRLGDRFKKSRATSGPMPFFTDDPEIASKYAAGKQDTSLEPSSDYADWFKMKVGRRLVDVDRAWWHLSREKQAKIAELLPHVVVDEQSGALRWDPKEMGLAGDQHWAWEIQQARGNVLKAAKEIWLNGGSLVGDEATFLEVLRMGGAEGFTMHSPWHEAPGVVPVYLSIQNPLRTNSITPEVLAALEKASKRRRADPSKASDQWNKRSVDGATWLRRLQEDQAEGTTHAWTSVPDWVTSTLAGLGFDGIHDQGGKMGGPGHNVWIPFEESQVKGIFNDGAWSKESKLILHQQAVEGEQWYSAAERSIAGAKQEKGRADSWWALLTKGSKKEELEATQIKDWLDQQKGTLTRDQVLAELKARRVEVPEKILGERMPIEKPAMLAIEQLRAELEALGWAAELGDTSDQKFSPPQFWPIDHPEWKSSATDWRVDYEGLGAGKKAPESIQRLMDAYEAFADTMTGATAMLVDGKPIPFTNTALRAAAEYVWAARNNESPVDQAEQKMRLRVNALKAMLDGHAMAERFYAVIVDPKDASKVWVNLVDSNEMIGREGAGRSRGDTPFENWADAAAARERWITRYVDDYKKNLYPGSTDEMYRTELSDLEGALARVEELRGKSVEEWNRPHQEYGDGTKYEDYVIRGHQSGTYRELLLYVPKTEGVPQSPEERSSGGYTSPHFDENGRQLMAHLRLSVHVEIVKDPAAKHGERVQRTMVIEEGQSDLHQAGQDEGYADPHAEARRNQALKEIQAWIQANPDSRYVTGEKTYENGTTLTHIVDRQGTWLAPGFPSRAAALEAAHASAARGRMTWPQQATEMNVARMEAMGFPAELVNRFATDVIAGKMGGIPNVPFKETWQELLMKRAITYAARKGFDRIALTPGQVHSTRWGTELLAWEPVEFKRQPNQVKAEPGWQFVVKEQHRGQAGNVDLEEAALARNLVADYSSTFIPSSTPNLRAAVYAVVRRQLNMDRYPEKKVNAYVDRVVKRMTESPDQPGVMKPREEGLAVNYDRKLRSALAKWVKAYGGEVSTRELKVEEAEPGDLFQHPVDTVHAVILERADARRKDLHEARKADPSDTDAARRFFRMEEIVSNLQQLERTGDEESLLTALGWDPTQGTARKFMSLFQSGTAVRVEDLMAGAPAQPMHVATIPREGLNRLVREGLPLFQKNRGRIEFTPPDAGGEPLSLDATLLADADASTAAHELGHYLGLVLGQVASTPKAAADHLELYRTALDFMGYKDHAERLAALKEADAIGRRAAPDGSLSAPDAARLKEIEAKEEKLSAGFEQYLGEGQAPSVELARVFARYKYWMLGVYKRLEEIGGTYERQYGQKLELSKEVRAMFDRLLASEEKIAEVDRDLVADQFSATLVGLDPAAGEELRKAAQARRESGELELYRVLAKEDNREREVFMARERDQFRKEVDSELGQEPVYQATQYLQDGLMPAPKLVPAELLTVDGKHRLLDREELLRKYGADFVRQLPNRSTTRDADRAAPADLVAEHFGFQTGDELVKALQATTPRAKRIEGEVEKRMLDKFGAGLIHDPGPLTEAALDAAHTLARVKEVIIGQRILARKLVPELDARFRAIDLDALEKKARALVEASPITEVSSGRALEAERAGAKTALEALGAAARETNEFRRKEAAARAFDANEARILQHFVWRAAKQAREEADKHANFMAQFTEKSAREKLGLAGADYLERMDEILGSIELRGGVSVAEVERRRAILEANGGNNQAAQAMAAWLEQQHAMNRDAVVPQRVIDNLNKTRHWKELSLEELREVRQAVESIAHIAHTKNTLLTTSGRREKTAILKKIEDRLLEVYGDNQVVVNRDTLSFRKKIAAAAARLKAGVIKPEEFFREADGGDLEGPLTTYLWNPVSDSANRWAELAETVQRPILEELSKMPLAAKLRWRNERFTVAGQVFTMENALAVALNWGNPSNRKKMIEGWSSDRVLKYGLTPWSGEATVKEILAHLNRSDWELVDRVGQQLAALRPHMEELEKRMTGLAPRWVKVEPFEVALADGTTFRSEGYYYPVVYDRRFSSAGANQGEKADLGSFRLFGSGAERGITPHGHLQERLEDFARPIDLSLVGLYRHLSAATKDVAMREAMISAYEIISDSRFRAIIQRTAGEEVLPLLDRWIRDNANELTIPDGGESMWLRVSNATRRGISGAVFGLNAGQAFQNLTGVVNLLSRVDATYLAPAMAELMASPKKTVAWIQANSLEMRERKFQMDPNIRDTLKAELGKVGLVHRAKEVMLWGFQASDLAVANAGFLAAYRQAMAGKVDGVRGGDHDLAIRHAEQLVRLGLMGGRTVDLTALQRSPQAKWFTMFWGWAATRLNDVLAARADLSRDAKDHLFAKGMRRATRIMFFMMAGSVVSDLAVGKGPQDYDEDGKIDGADWARWIGKRVALAPLTIIPLVGPTIRAASDARRDVSLSPTERVYSTVAQTLSSGYKAGSAFLAGDDYLEELGNFGTKFAEAGALATGLPAIQARYTLGYWLDPERDQADSVLEKGLGTLYGKKRVGSLSDAVSGE